MKKSIKMGTIVFISNLFFYLGIYEMIFLYMIDDNTEKWLLGLLLLIVGIIGSAIPDIMVNIGIENINIKIIRLGMLIKYSNFLVCNLFINSYFKQTMIIVFILTLGDIICEGLLLFQIYKSNVEVRHFIQKVEAIDTFKVDVIRKYLMVNMISILLFLNIHETIYEFIVMLPIALLIHGYTSEKILKAINMKSKWKLRTALWGLEIIMLLLSCSKYSILLYGVFGIYYMIITDLVLERKTSVIKRRVNRKLRGGEKSRRKYY